MSLDPILVWNCKLWQIPCGSGKSKLKILTTSANWFDEIMTYHDMSQKIIMLNWKIFGYLWWFNMIIFSKFHVAFYLHCQSWSIMTGNHWQNTVLLGSARFKKIKKPVCTLLTRLRRPVVPLWELAFPALIREFSFQFRHSLYAEPDGSRRNYSELLDRPPPPK